MRRWGWILACVLAALGVWALLRARARGPGQDDSVSVRSGSDAAHEEMVSLQGRAPKPDAPPAAPDATATPQAAGAPSPPAEGAGLRVRLFDSTGDDFRSAARVTVVQESRETSGEARPGETFEMAGLPAGRALVFAVAEGWVSQGPNVETLTVGRWTESSLWMSPGIAVSGRVLRASDGTPVEFARVTAVQGGEVGGTTWSSFGQEYGRAATDRDGRFRFTALPLDQGFSLLVEAPGFRRETRGMELGLGPAEAPPLEFRLEPGGSLRGTVRGPGGQPVARVRIEVGEPSEDSDAPDFRHPYTAYADDDGRFEVVGLSFDAVYQASASASGLGRSATEDGIRCTPADPVARRDLRLRALGRLVVEVVDGKGAAAPAKVVLTLGEWAKREDREAAGTGRVEFDGVQRDVEYQLGVLSPGSAPVARTVRTEDAEETVVRVVLEAGLVVEGIVVDDLGTPVPNATVRCSEASAKTDEKGRFRLVDLGSRTASITVWSPGHETVRLTAVEPPASGLRVVAARTAACRLRLVLPSGASPPSTVVVHRRGERGGQSWGPEPWKDGVVTWNLESGAWTVSVRIAGYAPVVREVTARPGETIDLGEERLRPGLVLRGRVVDASGAGVAGALLRRETFDSVLADEHGDFAIPDLGPGSAEVGLAAEGFMEREATFEVGATTPPVVVTLYRGMAVSGVVTDTDGRPVAECPVFAYRMASAPQSGWVHDGYAETDATGRFELRLGAGKYRLATTERPRDAEPTGVDVDAAEGGRTEVSLRTR